MVQQVIAIKRSIVVTAAIAVRRTGPVFSGSLLLQCTIYQNLRSRLL
jgi:hypothetical protein